MDFGSLAGVILAPYLPGSNLVINNMVGLGIGRLVNTVWERGWKRYGQRFKTLSFWNAPRLVIKPETALYSDLETFLLERYGKDLHSCHLMPRNGEVSFSLGEALFERHLIDYYHGHRVEWFLQPKQHSHTPNSPEQEIHVQSQSATLDILRDYVLDVSHSRHSSQKMTIYRATIDESVNENGKRTRTKAFWQKVHVESNKCISNTIMNDTELFDDVAWFLQNRIWFDTRGITYKRGYLLSGPPGTGKTSAIKAIANEHHLDLYTVDLGSVETNQQFSSLMGDIQSKEHERPYLLVMEDLDYSPLFDRYHEGRRISPSCFLNELDGVTETTGRILIVTTNNYGKLASCSFHGALLRPGRVDKELTIGYCSESQYRAIVEQQFGMPFPDDISVPDTSNLSPAVLMSVIQQYGDNPEKFFEFIRSKEYCSRVTELQGDLESSKTSSNRSRRHPVKIQTFKIRSQKKRISNIRKSYGKLGLEEEKLRKMEQRLVKIKETAKKREIARKKRQKSKKR